MATSIEAGSDVVNVFPAKQFAREDSGVVPFDAA